MTGKTFSGMSKKYLGIFLFVKYLLAVSFSLTLFLVPLVDTELGPFQGCLQEVKWLAAGLTAQWETCHAG